MKKYLFIFPIVLAGLFITSCSKCYTCKQTVPIFDSNGNKIDEEVVSDEVCTADQKVLDDKEAAGWDCI